MASKITFEDCRNKFDEALYTVRTNIDVVKQGKLFQECVLFLKNAADELKRLEKNFINTRARQYIIALDNMINDVFEYGAKVSA
ncbi:hypothetical protein IKJ53_01100 [bacterium]|nr:hypothetical protein [bacterium]